MDGPCGVVGDEMLLLPLLLVSLLDLLQLLLHMEGPGCSCLMMRFMLRSMEGDAMALWAISTIPDELLLVEPLALPVVLFVDDALPLVTGELCGATASEQALPGGLG